MTNNDFNPSNGNGMFSFTLRDFLAIGFRHKRLLGLTFGGMMLGTVLAVLFMPSDYKAETKILVKRERVDPVVSAQPNSPVQFREEVTEEELNSEAALIQSGDVLRRTVTACNLQNRKGLSALVSAILHRSEETKIAKAVVRLQSQLKVEPVKKSDLISISYTSSDPKQAAIVLNTLANAYLQKHLDVQRPPGQVKFFEQETERYRQDLEQAETQLKEFAQQDGGVAPQMARDIALQKLNEFSASLESTRADLAATEHRIHDLEKQANSTPGRLTTQIHQSDDATVLQQLKSTLMNLELKRTELLTKYQPTYRLVQEVDKEIADTRASIATEESKPLHDETTDQNPTYSWIQTELAKAKADYSSLQAREAATQAIVELYRNKTRELEEKGLLQQDLLRTAKADEDNYLLYLHKREEARMSDALDERRILNVSITEPPAIPALPAIDPMLYGLIGTLLAATVSAGVVFTKEYFDPSFRTPTEVLSELNIPVLAAVPYRSNINGNGHNGHNGNGHTNGKNGNGNGSHAVENLSGVETWVDQKPEID